MFLMCSPEEPKRGEFVTESEYLKAVSVHKKILRSEEITHLLWAVTFLTIGVAAAIFLVLFAIK